MGQDSQPLSKTESRCGTLQTREAHQSNSGTASDTNGQLVDDPDYLYLHHERCKPNDVSTWNVRACKETLEHKHILELIK